MTKPQIIVSSGDEHQQMSLSTAAARKLTHTTKSQPQMQGITPRWLLRLLPWVDVSGGVYRLNKRLTFTPGDGLLSFTMVGSTYRLIPQELCEFPLMYGFEDTEVLEAIADRFVQKNFAEGDVIVAEGEPAERMYLVAHGRVNKLKAGKYGDTLTLGALADGEHFGSELMLDESPVYDYSIVATMPCSLLVLERRSVGELMAGSKALRDHVNYMREQEQKPQDKHGQAAVEMSAGHKGEAVLPTTFVAYERHPREFELSVVQTILNVHTRVADLYNGPMDQMKEQLRLTIEALRERQEYELINNPEFGLLPTVDANQRIATRQGPPTPDDMDELITRRRRTQLLLAHPAAIAAFGKECNRRGVYPETVIVEGKLAQAWRGIPLLPCDKIPVTDGHTTSILALRLGAERQGVIGLRPAELPDQVEPGLNVRFMGINEKAIMRYLVSAYHSIAALVPDAYGVLTNVELGRND